MKSSEKAKIIGINFIIITLFISLFWPYAYALKEEPVKQENSELNLLTHSLSEYVASHGDTCSNTVETISLDAEEYKKLVDAFNHSLIDGFGNIERMQQQQELDEAGVSENPGVNDVKNQFITTRDGKPTYLFDTMQHSATPGIESTCYLNNVVTKGYISYSAKVDQNIRYCSEYGDAFCENGHPDLDKERDKFILLSKAEEVKNSLMGTIGNEEMTEDEKWNQLEENYNEIRSELGLPSFEEFKQSCSNNVDDCIAELNKAEDKYKAGINIKARSTWNIVESNHTDLGIYQYDTLLAFPHNLLAYIKDLDSLRPGENIVIGINLAATVVGVTSIFSGVKMAKASTKLAEGAEDAFKDAKTVEATTEAIKNAAKKTDNIVELTKEGKTFTHADDADNFVFIKKALENEGVDLGKLEKVEVGKDYVTLIGKTSDGKDFINIVPIGEYESAISSFSKTKYGYNLDEARKISELAKELEGGTGLKKLGETPENYALMKKAVDTERRMGSKGNLLRVAEQYKQDMTWRSVKGIKSFLKWGAIKIAIGFNDFIRVGRIQAYITLAAQHFTKQPAPFYELNAVIFTLRPASTLVGEEGSYVDIIKTSSNGLALGEEVFPDDLFTNILSFLGVDLEQIVGSTSEKRIIERKITRIGDIVSIIDQENGAESLTQTTNPINVITTANVVGDTDRWVISSMNPDTTITYHFEDPKAYERQANEKYTAMGLISNNVNMTGLISVASGGDWATYSPTSTLLTKMLPSTKNLVTMALLGSFMMPLSMGTKTTTAKVATQLLIMNLMGRQFTEVLSQEYSFGQIVDINKAFESGERCKDTKDEVMGNLRDLLFWRGVLATTNMVLEIADLALAPTGIGMVASLSAQAVVGVADYYVSEQYAKAKETGLQDMKNCYETQFEFVGWQKILTEQGEKTEIIDSLENGEIQSFARQLGVSLNALSPEVADQINTIAQRIYTSTMYISADPVKGKSLIRLLGTKIYQVHFSNTASFQWYAEDACGIQFCTQTSDGDYKCMTKQGYKLLDSNGNVIIDGPQAQFMKWNNLESYASIPQKVINIAQDNSPLMKVVQDGGVQKTVFENECIKQEVARDIGVDTEAEGDDKLTTIMGNLETIVTPEAMIWFDGDEVAISFVESKVCGDTVYSPAQTVRIPGGSIEIMRDGRIKVIDKAGEVVGGDSCSYDIGTSGAIAFDNGMIMKARAGADDYTKLGGKPVLHMVIRDLLTIDKDTVESMGITGPCECIEGAEGVSCTTEDGEQGSFFGFKLQGELSTEDEDQMNNLLNDICFTEGTGQNGETFMFKDGQFCVTDSDGKEECYEVTDINENGLQTSDGGSWQIEEGANGPEWWYYNADGERTGNPIPIMWLNGLGGSMYNNPSTGKISIKNEFPFAINPSFHEYGALANGGFATPALPPWGGMTATDTGTGTSQNTQTNVVAQLPGLPVDPYWMTLFLAVLMISLLLIRNKYGKEEEMKLK